MNEETPYRNAPHPTLAHLGCAALVILLATSNTLGLLSHDFHLWLISHPYTMPLGFLGALAAAYLLEYSLTTPAMLTLLVTSAVCGGLSLSSINPAADLNLPWMLTAGPLGCFLTAAITLHLQNESLYRWQLCCIFIGGAVLVPVLLGLLLGEMFPVIFLCVNLGILTAACELRILFGRSYHEITSDSRLRSTVIAMVMFISVPVCKSIWYSFYYGRGLLTHLFRFFLRWW